MQSIARFAAIVSCLLVFAAPTYAAPISFTGSSYTQNFDTLPNSTSLVVTKAENQGPFDLDPSLHAQFSDVALTGWQGWKYQISSNGSDDFDFRVSPGGNSLTGIYSYGSNSSTDRALGALASQGNGSYRFGVIFQNDTGTTIDHFNLEYFGEQWRKSVASADKRLIFDFAIGENLQNISSMLPGGTTSYQLVPQLDFHTQVNVSSSPGAINTNSDAYRIKISYKVENIEWKPNERLILRWTDYSSIDGSNPNPGLAIDDLTFSVNIAHAPEPSALVMAGMAASGLLFLIRQHALRRRTE